MLHPFPVPIYPPDLVPVLKNNSLCRGHMTIKGNIYWLLIFIPPPPLALSLEGALWLWPLASVYFHFSGEDKHVSRDVYFFPSSSHLLFFFFFFCSLRESPKSSGPVCSGRTASVCQFIPRGEQADFMPNPSRWHQLWKGTVDAVIRLPGLRN